MSTLKLLTGTLALVVLSSAALHGQTTFFNSNAISIPAGGTAPITPNLYPSNVSVSGMTGTVSKVVVRLQNMSVNSPDLDMMLVAPDGKKLVFLSDSGNGALVSNVSLTIDDAAANQAPAPGLGAWTNGATFRPANHSTGDTFASPAPAFNAATESANGSGNASATGTLALFNGINPNGTWSLYVVDDVPDAGATSIAGGWSLTITTAASAATATSLTSSVNPSLPLGSTTITATVTSAGNPVTVGSVSFLIDNSALATVALNASGQASVNTAFNLEGLFNVSANYTGATGFGPSSGFLQQEVNNATLVSGNTFCNPGAILLTSTAIPYPQRIFVSGLSGTITGLKVQLKGISHFSPVSIDALLAAPNGNKMIVLSDTGATGDIVLDDAAANQLTASTVNGGTFRPTDLSGSGSETFPAPAPSGPYNSPAPTGTATLASTFGGINPNGTWTLFAVNDEISAGSITRGYCLEFTTTADVPTTTTVTASANPATKGQNVTFTATVLRAGNNQPATSGTVIFKRGATSLASVGLNSSGQASTSVPAQTDGSLTVTAEYLGVPGAFNVSNGSLSIQVDTPTTVNGNTFCNPGSITNNNGSGLPPEYPSRILVSSLPGVITNVTATLNGILQAFPADFDIMLVGPNANQNFVLLSDAGSGLQSGTNLTLSDAAENAVSGSLSGTFRPTANGTLPDATDSFASPAPASNVVHAAPSGTATFASVFGNTAPNGYWSLFATDDTSGTTWLIGSWCLTFETTRPDLTISKTHSGNFTQGQNGAQYSITVTNNGVANTGGTVTVTDTLPAGLTASSMSGQGWSCTLGTLTCTRSNVLAPGNSYPVITLTVNVSANAAASVINTATVSGGGDNTTSNNTAPDTTTIIQIADLTIGKTHSGNFTQGQNGAQYTLTVTNSGAGATTGTVTVVDALPSAFTAVSIGGNGWTCTLANLTCTRADALAPAASYPPIALTVNVSQSATGAVVNVAAVSGGGELNTLNNAVTDVAIIETAILPVTISSNPPGLLIQVDGQTVQSPVNRNWAVGSAHTIAGVMLQGGNPGTRYVASAQNVTMSFAIPALTVNYTVQHLLTVSVRPLGEGAVNLNPVSPDGFYDAGTNVQVQAVPGGPSTFSRFSGDLDTTSNPAPLAMAGPRSVFVEFLRPAECAFQLSKYAASVMPGGDIGRVDVMTSAGCAWTATASVPWITLVAGTGNGAGVARFQVGENTSPNARTGSIQAGGATLTIHQSGAGCTFTLAPASQTAPAVESQQSTQVTAPPGCQWTATGAPSWLTVGGALRTGPQTLPYTVRDNFDLLPRIGAISAGGQILPVLQKTRQLQQIFPDVPATHLFADYIALAAARLGTQGCGNGQFCPDVPLTRAEMAEFLIKGLYPSGNFAFPATPYFTDVTNFHPQFRYIQKLRELGITSGCTATTFCPAAETNRGQMAVFLIRARLGLAGNQTFPVTLAPYFEDVPAAHLFFPSIQKLRELGITTGCSATHYCPDSPVTKGQMSVFTVRALLTP
ncbi:MAG: Ig-like domain repeat protein [Bryobacterales bacterium]|nr:Ig-like domain repeat protein [Bryobacterales bacterium]